MQILAKMSGKELVGRTYEPLFPYYAELKGSGAFRCGGEVAEEGDGGGYGGGGARAFFMGHPGARALCGACMECAPSPVWLLPGPAGCAPPGIQRSPQRSAHAGRRVVADAYVTSDSGTGVVHQAPAFGEDDYRICLANGREP